MKVIVIIPAYNAADTIYDLVKRIKKINLEVVVIDDGSKDNTKEAALSAGATVLAHSENMGKGISLRDGFDYILKNNYDGIIMMDSDGQHEPEEINAFLKKAQETKADIVLGNRMPEPKNMPLVRIVTNKFLSFILSCICKRKIPDTQCGFKFISTKVLKNIKLDSIRFDIDSEILIKASKKNFIIESIPIKSIYSHQITSQIKPLKDTVKFLKLLFKSIFTKDA